MGDIKIRKVSDSTILKIDELAKNKKVSREEYLRGVLEDVAAAPALSELDNKYASLVKVLSDEMKLMNDIIDKNNFLFEKIIEKI